MIYYADYGISYLQIFHVSNETKETKLYKNYINSKYNKLIEIRLSLSFPNN